MSDDLLEPIEGEDQINLDDLDVKQVLDETPPPSIKEEVKDGDNDNFDDDLFDAAIEPTMNEEKPVIPSNENSTTEVKNESPSVTFVSNNTVSTSNGIKNAGKKYCCYISNFTWWTTDADLINMMNACDVDDIIDLRFFENRQNGQSRGFALIVLGSENSVKNLMEKLPSKPCNGQNLQVHQYSKANLARLEEMTSKGDTRQQKPPQQQPPIVPSAGTIRIDGSGTTQQGGGAAAIPGLVGMIRAANQQNQPPSQYSQPPPVVLRPPPQQQQQPQITNFMTRPPPVQLPTQNMLSRPPPNFSQPPPGVPQMMTAPPPLLPNQPGMGMQMQMMPNNFTMNQPTPFGMHQFNMPPPNMDMEQQLSAHEFEEIMSRNHVVSSSAISRAVSDAATGDYRSAIETLITAISLIRQSRIAKHERCKALITSLEDTVRGIESKHYSRKHRRSRSRSRSPDRRKHSRRRSRTPDRRHDYSPRRSRY